ncbi:MAG: hypothetical protein V2G48_01595 [bacterium JZ-2024 1]
MKRWKVGVMVFFLFGVVTREPKRYEIPFHFTQKDTLTVQLTASVDGDARVGFLRTKASGEVEQILRIRILKVQADGLWEMIVDCEQKRSTLKPAGLNRFACPKEDNTFLMHPLNPFNVGIYPLGSYAVGDTYDYEWNWDNKGYKGWVRGHYKLVSVNKDTAEISANIHGYEEYSGALARKQENVFTGTLWTNIKTGKPLRLKGELHSTMTPSALISSLLEFDVKAKVLAENKFP